MKETHVNTCRFRILSNWSLVGTDQSEWMLARWNQPTGWMGPNPLTCPFLHPAGDTVLSVVHMTREKDWELRSIS